MPNVYPNVVTVLSSEAKPPGNSPSDVLYEIDTGRRYVWNLTTLSWKFQTQLPNITQAALDAGNLLLTEIRDVLVEIRDLMSLHTYS